MMVWLTTDDDGTDDVLAQAEDRIRQLEADLERALATISAVDSLIGPPNETGTSLFDLDGDVERVREAVLELVFAKNAQNFSGKSKHPDVWITMDADGTGSVRAHTVEPMIDEHGAFASNADWSTIHDGRIAKLLAPGRKAKFRLVLVDLWDETREG